MKSNKKFAGKAVVIGKDNVDTDQIIPKQFLTRIERSGFEDCLFYHWRNLEDGNLNPEFELNHPEAKEAEILIAGDNFGCGSSREHAVWALKDYGFKAVISTSFADIFFNNALRNGLFPIVVSKAEHERLIQEINPHPGVTLVCDFETRKLRTVDGNEFGMSIDDSMLDQLTNLADPIEATLAYQSSIEDYEKQHFQTNPWFSPAY